MVQELFWASQRLSNNFGHYWVALEAELLKVCFACDGPDATWNTVVLISASRLPNSQMENKCSGPMSISQKRFGAATFTDRRHLLSLDDPGKHLGACFGL